MTISSLSSYTSPMRIQGLSGSGLDIDSIVTQLMNTEKIPLTRLEQTRQVEAWKQDAYRDMINLATTFKSTYLDSVTATTNLLSPSSFKKFKATATDMTTHLASTDVSVASNSDAAQGNHTIQVFSMAKAESVTSTQGISSDIVSTDAFDYTALKGKSFGITLDGSTKIIQFDSNYLDSGSSVGNTARYVYNKIKVQLHLYFFLSK